MEEPQTSTAPLRWDRSCVSRYGWDLRLWIIHQIARFREHVPAYDEDVLRFKIMRFLLRDVRPLRRHERARLAAFYHWATELTHAAAVAIRGEGDAVWHRIVCSYDDDLDSARFDWEVYGESDSDNEHWTR